MYAFGKALGLVDRSASAEELGDRALQAEDEGIQPEAFPSYAEYVKTVESLDYDPLKTEKYTEDAKLIKGAQLAAGVTLERLSDLPMESFLQTTLETRGYYTPDRMEELGNLARESKGEFSGVVGYLTGTEKDDEKLSAAIDRLVTLERDLTPDIADRDALATVLRARNEEVV